MIKCLYWKIDCVESSSRSGIQLPGFESLLSIYYPRDTGKTSYTLKPQCPHLWNRDDDKSTCSTRLLWELNEIIHGKLSVVPNTVIPQILLVMLIGDSETRYSKIAKQYHWYSFFFFHGYSSMTKEREREQVVISMSHKLPSSSPGSLCASSHFLEADLWDKNHYFHVYRWRNRLGKVNWELHT